MIKVAWTKKSLKNFSSFPLSHFTLIALMSQAKVLLSNYKGPGRMKPEMMACLCLQGFYMYPGVPNTTTVTKKADKQ